jgi:hypothetical protein|tara:strand:+ start:154 stop:423 length:270 start_codon:yes stop_codon:yes gene_type:complete
MKKNKAKATKVTKEELKEIQTLVQNINSAQMQVGQMEIDKANLLGLILNAKNQFNDVQLKLREKYGDVVVNVTDGSLKDKEDEQVNKEN